jgi:hypothetical protein
MPTDMFLACQDCRVFLDPLRWPCSWPVVQEWDTSAGDPELLPHRPTYRTARVTVTQIAQSCAEFEAGFFQRNPQAAWIEELLPLMQRLCNEHQGHPLFLINDTGDLPWDFEDEGWYRWKELPGRFRYDDSLYLPRNVIDDVGPRDADPALARIASSDQLDWLWSREGGRDVWRAAFEIMLGESGSPPDEH